MSMFDLFSKSTKRPDNLSQDQAAIRMVAEKLEGTWRALSNGVSVETKRAGVPMRVEIRRLDENYIAASAWLHSLTLPDDDRICVMLAFYMQTINSNMPSGRLLWNRDGEFGYSSLVVFDDSDPEYALSHAVDYNLGQLVAFGPGLLEVRDGVSPDVVSFTTLTQRWKGAEHEPVTQVSPECRFLERYAHGLNTPYELIPGGIVLLPGNFRVELSADAGGQFSIRATCLGYRIPLKLQSDAFFYATLANSNGAFSTIYLSLSDYLRVASRFDLYLRPGRTPSDRLLSTCWLGTMRDAACHAKGIKMVESGEDCTSALAKALSLRKAM